VVLIGDTGTGKELVASCLHDYSSRCDHAFVAINCGAIPENLLESELFGHEKGAFTAADKHRVGKLEFASNGTLFLDEIESMSMEFQVKLLRALQENTIKRVGSNKPIKINPRVICASKVNLKMLVDKGLLRLDLYYRLRVTEICIPKLTERSDDIPLLFQFFLDKACKQFKLPLYDLSIKEKGVLANREWPGNIRELKNLAQQFSIANSTDNRSLVSLLKPNITHEENSIDTAIENISNNMIA